MAQTGGVAGGALTDWISLGVLASSVTRDVVDDAVAATGKGTRRAGGKLPPPVMVYFVMALALFADDDLYDRLAPSPHVDDLLQEIDHDPTAIFWG
jgi:transposase IS4-like protein